MTASSDQAWQKKTHSFNGLNMFESSSLMFFQFDTRYFPAKHVADLQRGHFLLARSRTLFVSILPVAGHYPLFRCWLISFDGYIFVDEHPPPKKHINPVNDTPHISQCPTKSYMTLATLAAHSTE
jgi:hypothetical protein